MVDTARHEAAESDSVTDHDVLCTLMGQPAGGTPLDLGAPFKVLPSGVYFAPDPHAWRLLEPIEQAALAPPEGLGERVDAEGINPHWRRVLPFPFTARQLLQFAKYAMLPALCEWMEREAWHPPLLEDPALRALECWPRARALALFLAGGPDPDELRSLVLAGLEVEVGTASEQPAPGLEALEAAKQALARQGAAARHAPTRDARVLVLAWWRDHGAGRMTREAAADAIVDKRLVGETRRTIRNWLKGA